MLKFAWTNWNQSPLTLSSFTPCLLGNPGSTGETPILFWGNKASRVSGWHLQCDSSDCKASHNNPQQQTLLKPEKQHTPLRAHRTASLSLPYPVCSPSCLISGKPAGFEILPSAEGAAEPEAAKPGAAWGSQEESEQSCSGGTGRWLHEPLPCTDPWGILHWECLRRPARLARGRLLLLALPRSHAGHFCVSPAKCISTPPALAAPSWMLTGGKMGYEIPVNGIQLWKGALAHSRQRSAHRSGSWFSCRAGASARGVAKEGGAARPAARASPPRLAGPGSELRPEIPACLVLQPRSTSLESYSGTDFLSLVTTRDKKAPVGQSIPAAWDLRCREPFLLPLPCASPRSRCQGGLKAGTGQVPQHGAPRLPWDSTSEHLHLCPGALEERTSLSGTCCSQIGAQTQG